ncbi:MAG: Flp pilus assembly complex ATPase component TadA [Clostridia bacterium]|nr:Flp pilus assembly complex ATPase component TadA [Clostridia bacterium]
MFDFDRIKDILPTAVYDALSTNLNVDKLQEIRLRANSPVKLQYGNKRVYLTENGIGSDLSKAITVSVDDIRNTIVSASERSIYAYNDEIIKGYLSPGDGVRIGVCGEVVGDHGLPIALKNYSSVNIRIPHEIVGCSDGIMRDIVSNFCRAMIISPPGAGKTTMLRDIARNLSDSSNPLNVLIVDERNEIACMKGGAPQMNVGKHTDVISCSSKSYAFECAVRSMRPDVIITDEIFGEQDVEIIREAVGCGVGVIASAHAIDVESFTKRPFAKLLMDNRIFERYYFLSDRFGSGHVSTVCDHSLRQINVG